MQPEPPSAIPSEPDMKAPDQSSEGPKVITPDQSSEAAKPMAPEQSTAQGGQFLKEQTADDMLASSIIGKPAVNSQDETIGDVNDLVTDRSGKIIAALIGVGGFLGIGEKDVAVRFEDLKLNRDENDNVKVTLNISKETLASGARLQAARRAAGGGRVGQNRSRGRLQHLLESDSSSALEARWPKGRRASLVLERDLVVELLVEGAAAAAAERA